MVTLNLHHPNYDFTPNSCLIACFSQYSIECSTHPMRADPKNMYSHQKSMPLYHMIKLTSTSYTRVGVVNTSGEKKMKIA